MNPFEPALSDEELAYVRDTQNPYARLNFQEKYLEDDYMTVGANKAGDFYVVRLRSGPVLAMIAQVEPRRCTAVIIKGGNRLKDPVSVISSNNISDREMGDIFGQWDYQKVDVDWLDIKIVN